MTTILRDYKLGMDDGVEWAKSNPGKGQLEAAAAFKVDYTKLGMENYVLLREAIELHGPFNFIGNKRVLRLTFPEGSMRVNSYLNEWVEGVQEYLDSVKEKTNEE